MRVVRSAGQNVSPSDDGRLYDQIFTDGLFTDASITNLGANNVALSALYGTICGRDFTAEAQNIVVTLPEGDGEYTGYIYVEIDTSSDDVITINSALAPFTPTYEDINTNGAVVQMILAEYTATALAIQSITPVYKIASAGGLGSLAVIEASPARTNHSVGTYLVYDGMLYKVTRAIAAGEDLVVGTNISATTAGAEIVSLNKGLNTFVKTITFTATTSANGNVSLESYLNTYQNLIISVSAHLKSTPTSSIVCLPYQYARDGSGRICGIHCVDETANSNAIASTQIEGTIFFIKKQ